MLPFKTLIQALRSAVPQPIDTYFSNAELLLNFNGSDNSTSFIDTSSNPKALTSFGGAQIQGGVGTFNGTSSCLVRANSNYSGLRVESVAFTVEASIKLDATPTGNIQVIVGKAGSLQQSWFIAVTPLNTIIFSYSTTGTGGGIVSISRPYQFLPGVWYKIAVTRNGSELRIFVNGELLGVVGTVPNSWYDTPAVLSVGAIQVPDYQYPFKGQIDELRITKGIARYLANYTPSSAPFPNIGA